jgi:hypothetical protein
MYIAALAGIDTQSLPVRGHEQHLVSVKDNSSVDAEVAQIRTDVTERYQRFLAMLVERSVLPPDSRTTFPPQIDVEVEDHRRAPH